MENNIKTLLVAAVAMSFCATSAHAYDPTYLPDSAPSDDSPQATDNVIDAGDYAINNDAGSTQGWFSPWGSRGAGSSHTTLSFGEGTTFSGSGLIGIFFNQGDGSSTESVDLTNVDAANFSGQLIVLNNWDNATNVKLSGSSWSNVEYVFANAVDDPTLAANYGLEDYTRGDLNSSLGSKTLDDTLALQGDTTLAGVTGASKGTTGTGTASDLVLSDHEFITVSSNGDKLTIVGSETYAFNGTVGTSSARASFEMTGTGSQTFGGTNYLQDVSVTAGTLALDGVTNIAGSVTVATGSYLELGGEITLAEAISNSGAITIDSSSILFALDSLGDGSTYTVISGTGSITISGDSLTYVNFTIGGETLSSRAEVSVSDESIVVTYEAGNLIWNGTTGSTWTRDASVESWTNNGVADHFVNGDNVTFDTIGGSGVSSDVYVSGTVDANSITVNDDYTFKVASGESNAIVDAGTLTVSSGATLTIDSGVTLYLDHETLSNFSVDGKIAGTGTIEVDLTGNTYDSTINLGSGNEFAGTVYVHSGEFHLVGSDIGNGTYRIGNGVNIEIATNGASVSNDFIFEGTTQLHINSGCSLTMSGNITGESGATIQRNGAGTLTITGVVDIDNFSTVTSVNTASSTTEFQGSVRIGTLTLGGVGPVVFSGGGSVGTISLGAASTVTFSGDYTYTVTTINASAHANSSVVVSAGTTVNAGNLTSNYHLQTVQVDGTLNISGTAVFGTGSVDSYVEHFTGSGTVTVGTFKIGHDSADNGASVKIEGGLTFIAGNIASGGGSNHYLEIANATIGTSNASGITFGTDENKFVLSATAGESTTFNTSLYNVASTEFTDTGTMITIATAVSGTGAMTVVGKGSLVLSGANTYSGGTTISEGTVVAKSETALGSGDVSVASGATLQLDVAVTTSGTVAFAKGATLILGDDLLAQLGISTLAADDEAIAIIVANDITFGGTSVSSVSGDELNSLVNAYVTVSGYDLTWSWSDGTLSVAAVGTTPEPSAFGLMLGLGALCLVGTRRRRRRN